jgi:hypothetical protein
VVTAGEQPPRHVTLALTSPAPMMLGNAAKVLVHRV